MIQGWVVGDVGSDPASAPLPEPHVASFREGNEGEVASPQPHEAIEVGGGQVDVRSGDTGFSATLLAEFVIDEAFYAVLLDGFAGQGEFAPPPSRIQGFAFGAGNGVHLFGHPHTESGRPIIAPIRPREIAPAGMIGEAVMKAVYLSVSASTSGRISVTPIIDGRRLEEQVIDVEAQGDDTVSKVYEVVLSEPVMVGDVEYARVHPRGTWFTFEVLAEDTGGTGKLSINGAKLEWEPVRESRPGIVYTAEPFGPPSQSPPSRFVFGADGLLQYGGNRDDGQAYVALARPVEVGFREAGVESWFRTLYLVVARQNTEQVVVTVVPILDGAAQASEGVTLAPADGYLIEVLEVPLSVPLIVGSQEVSRYGMRGRWFTAEVSAPSKDVSLLGMYVEFDPVRETLN